MKHVERGLRMLLLVLVGAALLVVIWRGSGLSTVPNDKITQADFIVIILTALAVVLAAVTVFLAALAIIGWATFEERVKQSAELWLNRRFSEDDPRYVSLVEELKRESLKGTRQSYKEENESEYAEDAE